MGSNEDLNKTKRLRKKEFTVFHHQTLFELAHQSSPGTHTGTYTIGSPASETFRLELERTILSALLSLQLIGYRDLETFQLLK